jgi:hypothetical protein
LGKNALKIDSRQTYIWFKSKNSVIILPLRIS